jgi:hypothetical protein
MARLRRADDRERPLMAGTVSSLSVHERQISLAFRSFAKAGQPQAKGIGTDWSSVVFKDACRPPGAGHLVELNARELTLGLGGHCPHDCYSFSRKKAMAR